MRSTRSNTRARTAANWAVLMAAFWIPLIALALLCRPSLGAEPSPTQEAQAARKKAEALRKKAAAMKSVTIRDTTVSTSGDEGFTVRVITETPDGKKTIHMIDKKHGTERTIEIKGPDAPVPPVLPVPPDIPDTPDTPDFDRSNSNDLVRFGEDITIPADKVVNGDVVAFGGSVTVLGRVKGDCVAIGGSVHVKDHGVVQGDAVSMGGGVATEDSASVGGSNVSIGGLNAGRWGHVLPMAGVFGLIGTGAWLFKLIFWTLISMFFAWITLLLFRERFIYANQVLSDRFGKSFLFGLLGWVGLVFAVPVGIVALVLFGAIAAVILCITIIGIPVAILLVIALVLGVIGIVVGAMYVSFLAYLQGAMYLGRLLQGRKPAAAVNPYIAILLGIVLLGAIGGVGRLVGALSFFIFQPIGIALGIAATFLLIVFSTAGFGAMVVGRLRTAATAGGPWPGTSGSQWGFGSTPPPGPVPPQGPTPPHGPMPPPPPHGPVPPPPPPTYGTAPGAASPGWTPAGGPPPAGPASTAPPEGGSSDAP